MDVNEISCYKWDDKLILSNEEYGKMLTNSGYNESCAVETPFPSDYVLALFADLAYQDSPSKRQLPQDWMLLTTVHNKKTSNGYFGAAFWNPTLRHIVVAHRGTRLSNIGALFSDVKLASNSIKTNQSESAATFVHLVGVEIDHQISLGANRIQLSITGHSLGAWLAQMSTFTLKYFKRKGKEFVGNENFTSSIHAHTVTFESPGCRENLEFLRKRFVPTYFHTNFGNFYTLDMTVYLSAINPINSINKHVGVIYMTAAKSHSLSTILDQFDVITQKIANERVLHFESGVKASVKSVFKSIINNPNRSVTKVPYRENECSLNVFNDSELDLAKYWKYLSNYESEFIQKIKRRMAHFEIDFEKHIIKSASLNRIIATIKDQKPTNEFICDLLESVKDIDLNKEILEINRLQFQKGKFGEGYFFKDRYGLKAFLNSSKKALHIRVRHSQEFPDQVESLILGNICKRYESNDFAYSFTNLILLPIILKKNMFNNTGLKLLIIECYDMIDRDLEVIQKLSACASYKIVTISPFDFSSSVDHDSAVFVEGLGHCIKFQDLQEESQKKLLSEDIFQRCGKAMSIGDLIGNALLQKETSSYLNHLLPTNLLLSLIGEYPLEYLVLDMPYKNILNGITIEQHQEVDYKNIVLKCNKHFLFLLVNSGDDQVSIIEELNLPFQRCSNIESECLNNLEKIVYVFSFQNERLFLESICRFDLYIERKIVHRRIVDPKIFTMLHTSDQFFVYGNKMKVDGGNVKFCESKSNAVDAMEEANTNAHVFKIENNAIQWVQSKGSIAHLQEYLIPKTVDSAKILDDKIVIISGEPGQGKSTIVKKMFLKCYHDPNHWMVAIPLQLANFDCINDITINSAAQFILSPCDNNGESILQVLSFCLNYKTNLPIYLMFDGYDQIKNSASRNQFIKLINFLKRNANANILITTQNYLASELENGVSVPASYFDSCDLEVSVIDYLSKFWESCTQIFENANIEELKSNASILLSSAGNIFGEEISRFLAIPLHVRILAELMKPNSISPSTELLQFNDILVPYQKLIEVRYDIYFKRNNFPDNKILKQFTVFGIFEKLHNLAIKRLIDIELNFSEYDFMQELNKVGLVQSNHVGDISFLHDSLRDYFVAHFIYLWLENKAANNVWDVKYFIAHILVRPLHKGIRMFLNCHLQSAKIAVTVLNACKDAVSESLKQNKLVCDDGNTFFHTAVEERLDFEVGRLLMEVTSEDSFTELLSKRNNNQKTALFLIIENIHEHHIKSDMLKLFLEKMSFLSTESTKIILLSTLFTSHTIEEHLEIISQNASCYNIISETIAKIRKSLKQKDAFLEACALNKFKDLKLILERERDKETRKHLAQITNGFKETGLHITSSKEILQLLLDHGVDINTRDHHGLTPLARAIKNDKGTEIFNFFVSKSADITLTDTFGNAPFLHAIKQGNSDILRYFMKSGQIDVNQCNVFSATFLMAACRTENDGVVRWLLDKGADINAVDLGNLSALFHRVKSNRSKLIKFLKTKGANVNIQDGYGNTPLLYSIKKSNWNMVNLLVDIHSDPSICNNIGQHPVKILIEKQKAGIIEKIFKVGLATLSDLQDVLGKSETEYLYKYVLKDVVPIT
ncbi:hypothetical protein PPYR_09994 [Photinus pyralis]|uniref:NACHT domain-containing protein n=1 Tax=Photinus pyralis TaxID=7054 RepID=A0A5N4AF29_PHOPY|nr:uncharacterized protein LOC116173879 [Photinus pyralis]XP_031347464.1 uncharacterized protein LOC116173879 [Photinus pyralis]KAB0795933.1 hypothetical protein PPYR_09994 [Photinus pyralis]